MHAMHDYSSGVAFLMGTGRLRGVAAKGSFVLFVFWSWANLPLIHDAYGILISRTNKFDHISRYDHHASYQDIIPGDSETLNFLARLLTIHARLLLCNCHCLAQTSNHQLGASRVTAMSQSVTRS